MFSFVGSVASSSFWTSQNRVNSTLTICPSYVKQAKVEILRNNFSYQIMLTSCKSFLTFQYQCSSHKHPIGTTCYLVQHHQLQHGTIWCNKLRVMFDHLSTFSNLICLKSQVINKFQWRQVVVFADKNYGQMSKFDLLSLFAKIEKLKSN